MSKLPLRNAFQFGVGLFVAGLVMHTWLAMGLIVPVAVSGSSMAPTLRGPHQEFHCNDCGKEFVVGLDELIYDTVTVCPGCGRRSATSVDRAIRPGDRLIVDRTAFTFRPPRRWEVVVFRAPEDASELCVKRIVGLPGESVSFVDGDVWIDGRAVKKPRDTTFEIRPGDHSELAADGWRLGPGEYFVVGDNTSISDDSRNWLAGVGLDAKLLVGKPLGVH